MTTTAQRLLDDIDGIKRDFFRAGPYTHMSIEQQAATDRLRWAFTFMDFGMCHTIEGSALLTEEDEGVTPVVDGVAHHTWDSVRDALFEGRFERCMDEVHEQIGFCGDPSQPGMPILREPEPPGV